MGVKTWEGGKLVTAPDFLCMHYMPRVVECIPLDLQFRLGIRDEPKVQPVIPVHERKKPTGM